MVPETKDSDREQWALAMSKTCCLYSRRTRPPHVTSLSFMRSLSPPKFLPKTIVNIAKSGSKPPKGLAIWS